MKRSKSSGDVPDWAKELSHFPVTLGVGRSAHFSRHRGRILFRTFPEPEAEGASGTVAGRPSWATTSYRVYEHGPTEQKRSTIYSGSTLLSERLSHEK